MNAQVWPLIVGTLAILGLATYVTVEDPAPGRLGRSHGSLTELSRLPGCGSCHAPAGLTAGCLGCHSEIRAQREEGRGYHATAGGECADCHKEHHGEDFDVRWKGRDPAGFQHSHVPFILEGGHDGLTCDDCHGKAGFALPGFPARPRETTYLGVTQECIDCHGDVHEAERFTRCTACHDQSVFKPAVRFDHDRLFPLDGGHDGVACNGCHLSFDETRGTRCAECHLDPHRMPGTGSCEECHRREDPKWSDANLTVRAHARTGFPLDAAHEQVACEKCHVPGETFAQRFPGRAPDDCRACHVDTHDGQFPGRTCRECHAATHFDPPLYGRDDHTTFPLRDAHAQVDCKACHKTDPVTCVREFTGTATQCRGCHEDVHKGQFADDCGACHTQAAFVPARYDRTRHTSFPLRHGHAAVECQSCHRPDPATGVRRLAAIPRQCRSCHEDVHKGQFAKVDCDTCHDDRAFRPARYDVSTHARFALSGSHRAVACGACHKEVDGVRRFEGLSHRCRDCHNDPHGGQFSAKLRGDKDCTVCHRADATTFDIRPYDHARRTGYELRGAHADVACGSCHRPDRANVARYRATPTACASCHTDPHRGQFRRNGATSCERCHTSTTAWSDLTFDHNRRTRFALDRTHATVACDRCHPTVKQPDGALVVQYRPLGTKCGDCHDFRKR